ncbi:MAG: glutamine-hydrolyzing GMP synthase [Eubacteriaceae bacterium]|nr:glutamine-hydrolyzing GMP synthase [Eubacteriaceae bacterium]
MDRRETVLIIDFGAQYSQLIARRVREAGVYSMVLPHDVSPDRVRDIAPKGIILSGGPSNVLDADAPGCDPALFAMGIPVLGICYGAQLMTHMLGGEVAPAPKPEYGKQTMRVTGDSPLLAGVASPSVIWMSHTIYIKRPAEGFSVTAETDTCPVTVCEDADRGLYGVQFHPEVVHTKCGTTILRNFLYDVCHCAGTWTMSGFMEKQIEAIRAEVGDKRVICALSGGVDSSVAAALVYRAIGQNLTCIFVDHGLLRKNEGDMVESVFKDKFKMDFIRVNCEERYLAKLAGVSDPETKRKIIGHEFIDVFTETAADLPDVSYLLQGTIYPDVIESGTGKNAAVIKSHHNVGGLPDHVPFTLLEPLRDLFKDEVRALGEVLGLDHELVWRQPFPGPGLAIRILGEVTAEKLAILREADFVFRDEIAKAGLDSEIWQYFAVLPGTRSVGVMGDERTYDYTIGLRAVTSVDGMTADWARIPHEVLERISTRMVNEVAHVNRVVYDITAKPPSTIEWE